MKMNLSMLLLLLSSASLHDTENITEQTNVSSGIPPSAVNRPTLTNLSLLSVAKLRQKRKVQFSSSLPVNGTNLMWVTWNNSLPNNAASVFNEDFDRIDYICKYKCEAGFYTSSKGTYCYYPNKKKEYRGFPFEILVNTDNFEILEWKDDSYGSVPKNSVWTCPGEQIYVGKNKYGLGKVSTQDKVFYLPYWGHEYWYRHYQVLTTNENVFSQQIFSVKYNTDNAKILQFPPEVIHQTTISNSACHPVVKTETLSKSCQVQQRWDISFSIMIGAKTTITTSLPFIVQGQIEFSAEVRFQYNKGTTVIESLADTGSVELTVPPNHSCQFSSVRHKEKVDIPFTAVLRRTYGNGEIHTTSIIGTYDSIHVGKIQAVVDRCESLENSKPCPIRSKSSMLSNNAMFFSLNIIFLFLLDLNQFTVCNGCD